MCDARTLSLLRRGIWAMLAAATALAGCGSSSPSSSRTTRGTSSAAGRVAARDGAFTTAIPADFTNGAAAPASGPLAEVYSAIGPVIDGFRANVNVVRETAHGLGNIDEVARREIDALRANASQVGSFSMLRSLRLGGVPARAIDFLNRPGTRLLHQLQVFAVHGGSIYTVTYTTLAGRYRTTLGALRQVIGAWRWAK